MTHSQGIPTIASTIAFIQGALAKQDHHSGVPYWQHSVAVMERLPMDATQDEKFAALLHAVPEETNYSRADLAKMGYSARTLDIMQAVAIPKNWVPWKLPDEILNHYRASIRTLLDGNKRLGVDDDGKPKQLNFDMVTHRSALRVTLADVQESIDPVKKMVLPLPHYEDYLQHYAGIGQLIKDALREVDRTQSLCSAR